MNKFSKLLFGGGAILGSFALACAMPNMVYAASDITPPRGIITVEGATLRDGVYYTSSTNVTLNIDVEDDTTAKENIKMIVSGSPVTGEQALNNANWEAFTSTKTWTLTNLQGSNKIYLYLKDEAENISPSIVVDASSTFTVTYAGEGKNMPAPKKAKYGMLFNIAIEEPTLEGKYFLGWSLTQNGSVQWLSDGVIEPKYIKGDITLWAIYADEAPSLASQVQIGDYVDYPVYYDNVYTYNDNAKFKSTYTGWRVLDIDGDVVKLVSAGTPLTYYHGNNSANSVKAITEDFLTTTYAGNKQGGIYTYYLSLESAFGGVAGPYTDSVRAMNKDDLDKVIGETTTSGFGIRRYGSLVFNDTFYWLATAHNGSNVWYVNGDGGNVSSGTNATTYGVRPVVTLKSSVKTRGRNISGVWQLKAETKSLADAVKVGDYVNYPVDYNNVSDVNNNISTYKGWKVLSKDVDIDGNKSIGTVNLISAGVPLTYYHYNNTTTSIRDLCINFLNITVSESENYRFRKTGFNTNKTLTQIFTNKYTDTYTSDTSVKYPTYSTNKVSGTKIAGTPKVRAMTLTDIEKATGLTSIGNATYLTDSIYQNLFEVGAYYWLLSADSARNLWYVSNNGGAFKLSSVVKAFNELGIRPVVSLKANVETTGTDSNGVWQLYMMTSSGIRDTDMATDM